jgi:hypothetical protein
MSQGTFNDPVPNTVAVLKLSAIPTAGLATTVIGARISGSASSNVDTYAGYFNNISTVSGTGLAYGIFASGSFHNFGGETRFYQGTFNDPIVGTAASVKISAVPTTGYPSSVFTVGITGAASSGQNTFAGYFTNTSTVSGGGVNYGIYAIGTNHYFSGSVGIGTVSPLVRLHVGNGTQSAINGAENKIHIATTGSRSALITLANSSGAVTVEGQFESSAETADLRVIIGSTSNHDVVLRSNNVERMRTTSGGIIQIGGTNAAPWNITSGTVSQVTINDASYPLVIAKTSNILAIFNQIGTAGTIFEFKYQSNVKGSISTDGTNVAFNTSSDYRLKNDLKDFNGLNLINAIKTYNYEWKTNNTRAYGVLAHELAEIIPYAVHGDKDQLDDKGDILPQGVDYSKLVPILIKSIQELKAEFDKYKSTHP